MPKNPYTTPEARIQEIINSRNVLLNSNTLTVISKTQFWVKLVGCIGFGIAALHAVSLLVGLGTVKHTLFGNSILIYIIPVISMAIYISLSVKLIQYSNSIKKLTLSQEAKDLEQVYKKHHAYWKLLGIIAAVIVAIIIVLHLFNKL